MKTINDIYIFLNEFIPVNLQESWDNSGFLVGNKNDEIKGVVLTLDISVKAIEYAKMVGANLILSHHPCIFEPIKNVRENSVTYLLIRNSINAICMHTCFDKCEIGMNKILFELMKENLGLKNFEIFEKTEIKNVGFGFIADSEKCFDTKNAAATCKEILNAESVRYYDSGRAVKKIGICSGSGSGFLEECKNLKIDTLITGDVKHDRWIAAANLGVNLIDLGHYYTENVCLDTFENLIKKFDSNIATYKFNNKPFEVI